MLTTRLIPTAPFAFDLALDYVRVSPASVIERVEGERYVRAFRFEGRPVGLHVSSEGTVEAPALRLELFGEAVTAADLEDAVAAVRRIFSTDEAIGLLEHVAAADPVLGRLVRRFRGLRPVLIPDPFEALVWAIIGQQINITFAAKLKRALVERFGGVVRLGETELPVFPTAETLAALDHERDLLPIQFSRQKSRYTIELARAVCEGRIDLAAVGRLPDEEAIAELTRLPGIGRWTAEYALMRAYGRRDAMPAGDGGLKQIVGREYGLGRLATEAEVRAAGEKWAGWRGYAAFYWWYLLQQELRERINRRGVRSRE